MWRLHSICRMSSSPPPSPPSQETFERVFSLQRRVEPDHENHITSSFSVLDINNFNNFNNTLAFGNNSENLEIYTNRRSKKRLGKIRKTAQSNDFVYKGNLTCFPPTRSCSNLDCDLAFPTPTPAIPASTTSQENYYPLARNSISILSDSRVINQELPSNSFSSNSITTTPKPTSSIYSHSLLQPICKS